MPLFVLNMEKGLRQCSVVNCFNNSIANPSLSFFELPADAYLTFLWLSRIQRESPHKKESILVCEIHFETRVIKGNDSSKQLQAGAIPTLHLPVGNVIEVKQEVVEEDPVLMKPPTPPSELYVIDVVKGVVDEEPQLVKSPTPPPVVTVDQYTQTQQLTASVHCQTTKKLLNDYIKLKQKSEPPKPPKPTKVKLSDELKELHRLNDKYLNPNLARLVKTQAGVQDRHEGNRYTWDQKFFALNVFNHSSDAYNFLRTIFHLPSLAAVSFQRFHVQLMTDITENLLKTLKSKAEVLNEKQRYCVLSLTTRTVKANLKFDTKEDRLFGIYEVDGIQKPKYAKVVIFASLHGIFDDWIQPVSFALAANFKKDQNVIDWVNKIMLKMLEVGFSLRAVVTDMVLDYIAKAKNITPERPYFYFNESKIYCYFDSANLVRLIRDSFSKNDFYYDGRVAKWEHIKKCSLYDHARPLKLVPKLTDKNLSIKGQNKTKMWIVTYIFSKTVATALTLYAELKVLEKEAKDTAHFLILIENLYDLFNSTYILTNNYDYKRSYVGDESQVRFLREMYDFFDNIRLVDSKSGAETTHQAKFRFGFKVTINSLMSLFDDIKSDKRTFLFTKRLQKVNLDHYFARVRIFPTMMEGVSAFRRVFLNDTVQFINGTKNSEKYDEVCNQLKNLIKVCELEDTSHSGIMVKKVDFKDVVVPENNALLYVAGFLLVKCLKAHIYCESMKSYVMNVTTQTNEDSSGESFAILPPQDFLLLMQNMESKFKWYFESHHRSTKVTSALLDLYKDDTFNMPCSCFPLMYLKKIFIHLRIMLMVDFNNKNLERIISDEKFSVYGL